MAVVFTDGIQSAGERTGDPLDVPAFVRDQYAVLLDAERVAQPLADRLLDEAFARDEGRPRDDMSVLVVAVTAHEDDEVRRMSVTFPIPPLMRP